MIFQNTMRLHPELFSDSSFERELNDALAAARVEGRAGAFTEAGAACADGAGTKQRVGDVIRFACSDGEVRLYQNGNYGSIPDPWPHWHWNGGLPPKVVDVVVGSEDVAKIHANKELMERAIDG